MLFEEKHFGLPISDELSRYIRQYTNKFDWADTSIKTGVGAATIRDVVARASALTKKNHIAIVDLMRLAVKNCTLRISGAQEAKQNLEQMLEPSKKQV